ncbi:TRAP transporter substrate-binding protein [Lacrimispora sp.]|uniref:TRAP transporter substrate-binding protein n=1 Tax=Lacrimispora sp. TaxID=2719234 RepID=UPI0034617913
MKQKLFPVCMAAVLLLSGCSGSALVKGDEPVEIKFAHVVSGRTPKGLAAEEFKRVLEEKSEGKILVDIYPDSQLGTDQEITELMTMNAVHMNAPTTSVLTSFISEFELFDLPYLFTTEEATYEALNGALGEKFNEYLSEKNLVCLGYWTGGFKHLTNSVRPVERVDDLGGLKIRVSQSPLLVSQFRTLNAGGISVPFSELYTALQTGTVDGQENPLSNIASRRFYEVQKYMTLSSHGFMGYPVIISKQKYDSLPEELRLILHEAIAEVTEYQWEINGEKEQDYYEEIVDAGVIVSEFTEEAKLEYREKTESVYAEFARTARGQELLDIVAKYNVQGGTN